MKTIQLLITCLLFSIILSAQPVLTAAVHLPVAGDTLVRVYASSSSLFQGPSGSNVTWNFSSLSPSTQIDSGWFTAASGTPPWAYNLTYENHAEPIVRYDFYHGTVDSLSLMGRNHSVPDADPIEFHNPNKLLLFPMSYLDQFTDSYQGQMATVFGPMAFQATTHVEADAFGTVVFPSATYTDVLRIHKLDSVQPALGGMIAFDSYFFYSASHKFPILAICSNCYLTGNYVYSAQRNAFTTGLDTRLAGASISFGPNPFRHAPHFQSDVAGELSVFSLDGRKLQTYKVVPGSGENLEGMDHLDSGAYILQFSSTRGNWHGKALKQD